MTNKTHPELSNKAGTIASTLKNISSDINNMVSANAPTPQIKSFIIQQINNINDKKEKSPATKRFLDALNRQTNNYGINSLVWNTILAGDNQGVIK